MIDNSAVDKPLGRWFVFSLALAFFGTSMLDVLSSLFLVDLAKTYFGSSNLVYLAIVSQIVTISSIAAIVFGVLNGFLSVRVKHRTLLLFGALCIVIGAVGCLWAPNLLFLSIFYPFDGIGTIVVGAMAFTLIGESLPTRKESKINRSSDFFRYSVHCHRVCHSWVWRKHRRVSFLFSLVCTASLVSSRDRGIFFCAKEPPARLQS